MTTGTRPQIGNLIYDGAAYITVSPPGTITTAVVTYQTVTILGLQVGDIVSWNLLQTANTLVSIPSMYVSAKDTMTIGWSTEGATINGLGAQNFLIEIARPENASLGLTSLPPNFV